jgi:hypothetical protein
MMATMFAADFEDTFAFYGFLCCACCLRYRRLLLFMVFGEGRVKALVAEIHNAVDVLHEAKIYFILVLSFCFGLVLCSSLLWLLSAHVLTNQLDDYDTLRCSSLSHDPAVNAQFIGSCLPHMCLPFNASAVPRSDLLGCDESLFPYALAFHALMPLFPPALCECGEHVDPLGLHFASCIRINARNLLHNALRDCFYGSLHHILLDLSSHHVALLVSDKMSKSSTYIHHWYPLKANAPVIHERRIPYGVRPALIAPSKSPDILVSFFSAPHRPIFGDFVFASPRASDNTCHSQAAQVACNSKHS